MPSRSVSVFAYVVAFVLFLFAGFGVDPGVFDARDLLAFGLAAFALAHVLP